MLYESYWRPDSPAPDCELSAYENGRERTASLPEPEPLPAALALPASFCGDEREAAALVDARRCQCCCQRTRPLIESAIANATATRRLDRRMRQLREMSFARSHSLRTALASCVASARPRQVRTHRTLQRPHQRRRRGCRWRLSRQSTPRQEGVAHMPASRCPRSTGRRCPVRSARAIRGIRTLASLFCPVRTEREVRTHAEDAGAAAAVTLGPRGRGSPAAGRLGPVAHVVLAPAVTSAALLKSAKTEAGPAHRVVVAAARVSTKRQRRGTHPDPLPAELSLPAEL